MKIASATALALLAGIAIGAFGVHTLHAQKKPPAYIVADNEVTDQDNYMKVVAPVAEKTTAAAGGRFLARGKPISLSGEPPKGRLVIVQFENMEQGLVHDDDTILGVGCNVAQLVCAQTRVERVDHRSHRRDREVQLEVLGLVPKEGGHPIAVGDAQVSEPVGKPTGALGAFAKGRSTHGGVRTTRHDRGRRIQSLGPLDQDR